MCWETQLLRANFLWVIFALLYLFWPKHARFPLVQFYICKKLKSFSVPGSANVQLHISEFGEKDFIVTVYWKKKNMNEQHITHTVAIKLDLSSMWKETFRGSLAEHSHVDNLHFHLLDNILIVPPPVSINLQTQPQATPWNISGEQKSPPINL